MGILREAFRGSTSMVSIHNRVRDGVFHTTLPHTGASEEALVEAQWVSTEEGDRGFCRKAWYSSVLSGPRSSWLPKGAGTRFGAGEPPHPATLRQYAALFDQIEEEEGVAAASKAVAKAAATPANNSPFAGLKALLGR